MLTDPRSYPDVRHAPSVIAHCYECAASSLRAAAGSESRDCDAEIETRLREWLRAGDGDALAALLSATPSVDVHRHILRLLASAAEAGKDEGLALTMFAIPVVFVAGSRRTSGEIVTLDAVLPDASALASVLRDNGALAGNRTIAMANALVGVAALDVRRLPAMMAAARLPAVSDPFSPLALPPSPIDVQGASEGAHLRFLMGAAVATPGARLLREANVGRWGMPLAHALSEQIRTPDITLVALPRPAQSLVTAVHSGLAAQREISAQLFASNAIRRMRANFGEPTAVISAHRLANGGGDVRLSLSTPFDPRDAEGFRAPLYAPDRVGDVVAMLIDLMRDCRVTDIRVVEGVHPDRDAGTGLAVLYKPETIPLNAAVTVH